MMAMSFALLSLYSWIKLKDEINLNLKVTSQFYLFLSLGLITSILAGLIKIQFLVIPFSSIVFFIKSKKNLYLILLCFLIAFAVNILWYYYAINLTKSNNLKEFGLWLKTISLKEGINTIIQNISSDTPELLIGWPLFVVLIVLTIKSYNKIPFNTYVKQGIIWGIFFLIFYILGIERMKNHAYYFMAILPLITLYSVYLLYCNNFNKKYIYILILFNTTWAMVRIVPNNWMKINEKLPKEFTEKKYLDEFNSTIKPNDRVFIGPDKSGCIYFYFTNTKGFSFANENELFELDSDTIKLNKVHIKKANKLIIKDVQHEKKLLESFPYVKYEKNIGSFRVYNLLDNKQ